MCSRFFSFYRVSYVTCIKICPCFFFKIRLVNLLELLFLGAFASFEHFSFFHFIDVSFICITS